MHPTHNILLQTQSAVFGYGDRPVIEALNLQLCSGQCLAIFGPNGAGKTTLIRGLTGLIKPMSGSVKRTEAGDSSRPFRFGYIPQQRAMDLHWPMTGLDAACMASSASQTFGWMRRGKAKVIDAMKILEAENLAAHSFARLSGGQQQRLLLAGAIAADPTVLILDEPTDGLDVQSRKIFIELLHRIQATGVSIVIISHQIEDLLALSQQIAWLHPGVNPDLPTTLEMISPKQVAQRMVGVSLSSDCEVNL